MSIDVLLPKLGFSMTSGTITEWLIADGAKVVEGEPLFMLEADKATNEVEAPASGVLTILVATRDDLDVGTVIARIG